MTATLLIIGAFATIFNGCKLKKDKEKELKAESSKLETQRNVNAKHDLEDSIRLASGVSGEYQGEYQAADGLWVHVQARITPQNIPHEKILREGGHDSEFLSYRDAINLNIELEEKIYGQNERLFLCSVTGLKPDYISGMIKFNCSTPMNGATRTYYFAFEDESNYQASEMPAEYSTLQYIEQDARTYGRFYVEDRIKSIEQFKMVIVAPKNNFVGKISRKK